MEKITVPFITGDGVRGAEVTPSMQAVVNAAVKKPMVTGVASNGKKCWRENVPSTKPAPGCRMKQWKPSAPIRWASKVR